MQTQMSTIYPSQLSQLQLAQLQLAQLQMITIYPHNYHNYNYGVATISRLLKIIGLFYRISSLL